MSQKSYQQGAKLYLIPTPIGNLEDITLRAINTLKEVEVLFCEDTRVTSDLLHHLGISKKLIHCDDHNEEIIKEQALQYLQQGRNIGLVTDRGTPIISDPGYRVVEYLVKLNYTVVSLPGATAFVPALTMSGLNPAPFLFYGFLNNKVTKREKELQRLERLPYTLIFYEAPHRIKATLLSIQKILGDREIALCREISKLYEEVYRGTVTEVLEEITNGIKGEIVIVVEANQIEEDYSSLSIIEHINLYLEDDLSLKEAIKLVAKERNLPKSIVYKEYHKGE